MIYNIYMCVCMTLLPTVGHLEGSTGPLGTSNVQGRPEPPAASLRFDRCTAAPCCRERLGPEPRQNGCTSCTSSAPYKAIWKFVQFCTCTLGNENVLK